MQNIFTTHFFLITLNLQSATVTDMSLTEKYEYILNNNLSEKYKTLLQTKKIPEQLSVFEQEFEKLKADKD